MFRVTAGFVVALRPPPQVLLVRRGQYKSDHPMCHHVTAGCLVILFVGPVVLLWKAVHHHRRRGVPTGRPLIPEEAPAAVVPVVVPLVATLLAVQELLLLVLNHFPPTPLHLNHRVMPLAPPSLIAG